MEYVECFNRQNQSLEKKIPRHQMKNAPEYFRVMHAWITNEKGQYLVQKRAKKDDTRPFLWAFTSGMFLPGEAPIDGIIREVAEELTLPTSAAEWSLLKIITTDVPPYKTHTYIFHLARSQMPHFQATPEVSALAWWSYQEIIEAINQDQFWNYPVLLNAPDYFKGGPHA